MRLAAAVMFVHELDRSVLFYKELLAFDVTVRNNSAALLAPTGTICTCVTQEHVPSTLSADERPWLDRLVVDGLKPKARDVSNEEKVIMTDDSGTQDQPIQNQHSQPDNAKAAGILVQEESDLAGHDEAHVLSALRQRFTDIGMHISEDTLQGHAHRIASLKPNNFSKK